MTTITAAKLREMAHTLGTTPEKLKPVIGHYYFVTIDDTPADTDETEAQEAAMQDDLVGIIALEIAERRAFGEDAKTIARAIIPMVLEEAAKVAHQWVADDIEGKRLADLIRAMGAP